jgi:hypothetical protein
VRASFVWASTAVLAGRASPHGELLIDLRRAPLFRSARLSTGGADVHALALPPGLAGHAFTLQACILDAAGPSLTNAIDVLVGP